MNNSERNLVDSIVAEIDADVSVIQSDNFAAAIRVLLDNWQATHEALGIPDEVKWELFVLDMSAVPRRQRQESLDQRFRLQQFEFLNREADLPTAMVYPNVAGLMTDEQALAYYRQRVQATPNPIRKARYADFVWCALRQQRDRKAYQYALEAAEAYLAQAPLCVDQEAYIELVENLDRAGEIAVQLSNQDLAARVVEAIIGSLQKLVEPSRRRWVLEMGDSMLFIDSRFHDLVSVGEWQQIREICNRGILHFDSEGNQHLARSLMELASNVSNRLGDQTMAWDYLVQLAQSLEKEASLRENREGVSGGSSVAYKFMEDAMRFYQWLVSVAPSDSEKQRMQAKVQQAKREVRRLIRQAESEMQAISVSVEMPHDAIEQIVSPLLKVEPEQALELLAWAPFLLPDIEDLRRQAAKTAKKYVFASLFGRASLRNGRKVDETPTTVGEAAQFLDHLAIWFQTHAQLLNTILHRLREEKRFSSDSFMTHLHSWEFLDEADVPFIEVGLDHYLSDDFVSALHVLVPRIEHMLKSAFEQAGLPPIVVPNQRQIREQTLGDFLRREEVRQALGEDIWYYLYYSLVDERGLDLRNDVAHGWIVFPACSRVSVQIVLFAILLLTRLRRTPRPGEENLNLEEGEEN